MTLTHQNETGAHGWVGLSFHKVTRQLGFLCRMTEKP